MMNLRPLALAGSALLFAVACSDDDSTETTIPPPSTSGPGTITEVASSASTLTTLVNLVTQAGLADALGDPDASLTVFAPDDTAFQNAAGDLPSDPDLVANVLLHHVVMGEFDSAAVTAAASYPTLAKTTIAVDAGAGTIGGAPLSATLDVEASNGIVHILDGVMLPPNVLQAAVALDNLSSLETAVGQAASEIGATLEGDSAITVFAPVNAAFMSASIDPASLDEATATDVLSYHVVQGQVLSSDIPSGPIVTVNGASFTIDTSGAQPVITDAMGNTANIIETDIRLLNGVVHLIDGVLMPASNIVELAQDTPDLSTLVTLVGNAGLVEALSDETTPLTVFAPTDTSFMNAMAQLPADQDLVTNILLHHVVAGEFDSAAVLARTEPFTTLAGTQLAVDAMAGTIGNAPLDTMRLDINASNGIVHILGGVMLPPSVLGAAAATPDLSQLAAAVGQASTIVPDTLDGSDAITVFAPINSAFSDIALDPTTLDQATADSVLTYHVVQGQVLSTQIPSEPIVTLNGKTFTIDTSGQTPVITDAEGNTANIIATDLRLRNGVVHLIDGVLFPAPNVVEVASSNAAFSTLTTLATDTGLVPALSDETARLTVFAPTDTAFMMAAASLPSDNGLVANILLHHVVAGEFFSGDVVGRQEPFTTLAKTQISVDGGTIGGATLSSTLDLNTSNGVIHVLDQVMLPPTVLEAAVALEDLSSLETAVGQASAVVPDTLNGAGPITVFAPINQAFTDASINPADLTEELANAVLTYHVVQGQVLAGDIVSGAPVPTVNGETFTIDTSGAQPTITDGMNNTVNIIDTDIRLQNGVVHLIDGVLMPPN